VFVLHTFDVIVAHPLAIEVYTNEFDARPEETISDGDM